MKIPGLSFSWKRAVGITQLKQKIARKTGIPTTKAGIQRKIGAAIIKSIFRKQYNSIISAIDEQLIDSLNSYKVDCGIKYNWYKVRNRYMPNARYGGMIEKMRVGWETEVF